MPTLKSTGMKSIWDASGRFLEGLVDDPETLYVMAVTSFTLWLTTASVGMVFILAWRGPLAS